MGGYSEFTNVIVTRLRKCNDLVREGKVFVKNKAKVASGVGCSKRGVVYYRELLFKSNKKQFSFRRVESGLVHRQGSSGGISLLGGIMLISGS